jgi:hypothetical protein
MAGESFKALRDAPATKALKNDEIGEAILEILATYNLTAFQAMVVLREVENVIEHKAKL